MIISSDIGTDVAKNQLFMFLLRLYTFLIWPPPSPVPTPTSALSPHLSDAQNTPPPSFPRVYKGGPDPLKSAVDYFFLPSECFY